MRRNQGMLATGVAKETDVRTIVVLALSRMGDIYQLYPALLGLRESSPDARIFLVIYREFVGAMEPLRAIDGIIPIDGSELKKQILSKENPVSLYRKVSGMIGAINDLDPDLLINLTPNRIGAMMGYLINAREKRGLSMTRDGYRTHLSPWILYLSTFVKNRLYNDLNLVDLFKNIAGVGAVENPGKASEDLPVSAHVEASELLRSLGLSPGCPLVAMATGASVEIKRWPVDSFSSVCQSLLFSSPSLRIVLLGQGPEDRRRNQEILSRVISSGGDRERIFDLTGATSVMTLSAMMSRVDLLLSNDTGTMHVASLFGAPVVCLSFSQLFHPETGPALPGNVVLSSLRPCAPCAPSALCNNPVCRDDLRPDHVTRVILLRLVFGRRLDDDSWSRLLEGLRAIPCPGGSLVSLARRDDVGEIHFVPAGEHPKDAGWILRPVYGALWRRVLSGFAPGDPVRIVWPEVLDAMGEEFRAALSTLCSLAEEGISLTGEERKLSGEAWASRLEDIDRRIRQVGDVSSPVAPLTTMFFLEKESIGIRDPFLWTLLMLETGKAYCRLRERASWLLSCHGEEGGREEVPGHKVLFREGQRGMHGVSR